MSDGQYSLKTKEVIVLLLINNIHNNLRDCNNLLRL